MTDPIIKWAGGKRRMVERLRAIVLKRLAPGGRYVEPFLGGGAVALSMPDHIRVTACDVCVPLIETYAAVIADPDDVHRRLATMVNAHTERKYYEIRDCDPSNAVDAAARFIYLNKAGFNGLYRTNRSGRFNVPCGKRRGRTDNPPGCPPLDELRIFADRASGWILASCDFEPVVESATAGDVVYADPPYRGTFRYGSGFDDADQRRLAAALRRAARRGVGVITTNADDVEIKKMYQWARVESVDETWSVAADHDRRGASACVLAVRP